MRIHFHNEIISRRGLGLLAVFLIVITASCTLQGQESLTTETYDLQDFSGIYFNGIGTVTITQGEANSITIVSPTRIWDHIRYQVNNDTLRITLDDSLLATSLAPEQTIQFHVTAEDINQIDFFGAGTLQISDLNSTSLELTQHAVSSIVIENIQTGLLKASLNGGGTVQISGAAREQMIDLDGSVKYEGAALQSQTISITLSGSASAVVWAESNLSVTAGPNTTLQYAGLPEYISISGNAENVAPIE